MSATNDSVRAPILAALNSRTVLPSDKARRMLDYRNVMMSRIVFGYSLTRKFLPAVTELLTMRENNHPIVWLKGEVAGLFMPLFQKLARDMPMQLLVDNLARWVLGRDPSALRIESLWNELQMRAAGAGGGFTPEGNLRALQAITTLFNVRKLLNHQDQPEAAELYGKLPPGLADRLSRAFGAIGASPNTEAAVMSRGAPANTDAKPYYSADHNYHFFSHAYLSLGLQMKNYMLTPEDAEVLSALIGAQYELLAASLKECQCNSGLKDILMNAEGAAFGTLLKQQPAQPLPPQDSGPPLEERTIPSFATLTPQVQKVADEAADLSATALGQAVVEGALPF